ncbi:TadE family type IV pilus minor pilin [Arthrobacter sp. Y-9]|uniref:TadE family type IV pilus minor pilin n=1 Tax=Arthrobacter sp. Y-9 TaxID=3039385 RepID=UPI00241D9419|nr:TadE family type IV pilus minor pilin [Arthrobacter sp. Y-9]WFR83628.1 TadE family type IV pilus minor pilin [Arthrobacter sp. Y-9]
MRERRRGHGRPGERGTVTAEFAVTLPVVVSLLAILLGAVAAGSQQVRLEEAARAASRALARGDSQEAASAGALRLAGDRASLEFHDDGAGYVRATVRAPAPGVIGAAVPWVQTAQSTAALEDPGGTP